MAKITYNTSPYTDDADLPHSPAVTPAPCPGCEAVARERDDLRARLAQILIDYNRDIKQDAEEALRALLAETEAK